MTPTSIPQEHNALPFILLISGIATIGGFLFGFDSGVINGTIDGLQQAFDADDIGTGLNVSSMLLGCAVGAFAAGSMADHFGRRSILILTAVLFIISAWGSGAASSSFEFIIYRIIGGLAVGAASVITPAYISEIAPAHIRGRLSSIQQVAIIFGLFCAFSSNYLLAKNAGSSTSELWAGFEAWRWMFWAELLPACLFLGALFTIPESPRYLVSSHQEESATKVLSKLLGANAAVSKLEEIRHTLSQDHTPRLADLFENGRPHTILLCGIGLAVFQQLVGINVVFYYGAVLWQAVGFSEGDALLINVFSGALSIAGCLVALSVIDHIGRKPLLLIGSIGMAISLIIVAICFASITTDANGQTSMPDQQGLIALIAANVYLVLFNTSWGPVMWVMLGEMFPNQIRGSGLAVSGLFQWLANFLVTMSFPILLNGIGLSLAYTIYASFAALSVFFVWRYINETKNKELEEMQADFAVEGA